MEQLRFEQSDKVFSILRCHECLKHVHVGDRDSVSFLGQLVLFCGMEARQ